jgi:hypothetical protein
MEADIHGMDEFPERQLRQKKRKEKLESDETVGQFPKEEYQSGITNLFFESRPPRLLLDTCQSKDGGSFDSRPSPRFDTSKLPQSRMRTR